MNWIELNSTPIYHQTCWHHRLACVFFPPRRHPIHFACFGLGGLRSHGSSVHGSLEVEKTKRNPRWPLLGWWVHVTRKLSEKWPPTFGKKTVALNQRLLIWVKMWVEKLRLSENNMKPSSTWKLVSRWDPWNSDRNTFGTSELYMIWNNPRKKSTRTFSHAQISMKNSISSKSPLYTRNGVVHNIHPRKLSNQILDSNGDSIFIDSSGYLNND